MMIPVNELRDRFCTAWRDLFFFPLPFAKSKTKGGKNDAFFRLLAYPVIGALTGMGLMIVGFLSNVLLSRLSASIVFGLCALFVMEGKDRSWGISRLVRMLTTVLGGDGMGGEASRQALYSAFFTLVMLAKLVACVSLFFHGNAGMVGAALIVNFSFRSELLCFGDVNPHGVPALSCSIQQRRVLWGATMVLLFLMTLSRPSLFLLLGLGEILLILTAERVAISNGKLEMDTIVLWGSAAETLALLLAALLTL